MFQAEKLFWCHSLAGVLKAAKERNAVQYTGTLLQAGSDDSVIITLLQDDIEDANEDTCMSHLNIQNILYYSLSF